MPQPRSTLLAATFLCAACVAPLPEDRARTLGHRFSLSVGGEAFADYETGLRLDGDGGKVGTDIDFEEDLGFETTSQVFRMDADWRWANRHGLTLSAFQINRSASRSIDETISFGDEDFTIGAELSTNLDITVAKLAYRYYFVVRDRWELAGSLGLHALDVDVSLNANQLGQSESADALAPLPVLGLHGAYALSDRTRVSLTGEVFAVEFEGSEGSLVDTRVTLDHDLGDHWGVGVGYNGFDLEIDVDASRFDGEVDWKYNGVLFYVRALF